MKTFERICHFVTLLFAFIATIQFMFLAMRSGLSAPQYAAEAAGICAMVIIPYIFTRSISRLVDLDRNETIDRTLHSSKPVTVLVE